MWLFPNNVPRKPACDSVQVYNVAITTEPNYRTSQKDADVFLFSGLQFDPIVHVVSSNFHISMFWGGLLIEPWL